MLLLSGGLRSRIGRGPRPRPEGEHTVVDVEYQGDVARADSHELWIADTVRVFCHDGAHVLPAALDLGDGPLTRDVGAQRMRGALCRGLRSGHQAQACAAGRTIQVQKIEENGFTVGGRDQAWLYRAADLDLWRDTPGALAWLAECAPALVTRRARMSRR
jgi:hypothetical protein